MLLGALLTAAPLAANWARRPRPPAIGKRAEAAAGAMLPAVAAALMAVVVTAVIAALLLRWFLAAPRAESLAIGAALAAGSAYAAMPMRWVGHAARTASASIFLAASLLFAFALVVAAAPAETTRLLVLPAAALFLLHFAVITRYGWFRDELYYVASTRHLAFGYVDHPPFSIAFLALWTRLLGESLAVVRIPAHLSGAALALLTGLSARLTRMSAGYALRSPQCQPQ